MAETSAKPSKPLTKADIVDRLAATSNVDRKAVAAVLDTLVALAASELARDGGPRTFRIPGLVTLRVATRSARAGRTGRHPRTGAPIEVPPQPEASTVRASAAGSLRGAVRS